MLQNIIPADISRSVGIRDNLLHMKDLRPFIDDLILKMNTLANHGMAENDAVLSLTFFTVGMMIGRFALGAMMKKGKASPPSRLLFAFLQHHNL